MRLLFVHQNFPGQYRNLLLHLAATHQHEIVFLTQRQQGEINGVRKIVYTPARQVTANIHRYLRTTEAGVLNGQAIWRVATQLKGSGFIPDLMIGHNAWGETLFLKDVFPQSPLLSYFEFFYRPTGSDIDFDPEYPDTTDTRLRSKVLNALSLMGMESADWGQTPSAWQWMQFPQYFRERISLLHEGIDTDIVKPDADVTLSLGSGATLRSGDEVVTYVSRGLEPYRGFHIFMRALPEILRRRPKAHVLIIGSDEVSYGAPLADGQSYRNKALMEVGEKLDMARVHFLGQIPYHIYLKVLQVSSAHIYLTYPFVVSWSMFEAMSAGCLVIGSSTPPVTEFIRDRENGLLVDFFSVEQIADAVNDALDRPADLRIVREAARQTIVERYDFGTVCLPAQLEVIDALVAGRKPVDEKAGSEHHQTGMNRPHAVSA